MTTNIHSVYKTPTFLVASNFLGSSSSFQTPHQTKPFIRTRDSKSYGERLDFGKKIRGKIICGALLPVDPWAPTIDSESIASQLFAVSLFPYIGFLYFITKSKSAPKLTLFGFYFLLTFVGATIPAGIYAKVHYGTALSNVDWLHGGAESLLTLTNLFIVMGLREALRETRDEEQDAPDSVSRLKEKKEPSI